MPNQFTIPDKNNHNQLSMKSLIKITLILAATLFSCCQPEIDNQPNRIILNGQINGVSDTSLQFTFEPFSLLAETKSLDIEVDETGKFNLTLDTDHPLKGFISFGKVPKTYKFDVTFIDGKDSSMQVESVDFRMIYLYLSPGDSLTLSVDADQIQTSIEFAGTGAANNYFVNQEEWQFNDYKNKYLNNYYYLTYLDPVSFKKEKLELRNRKLQFLENFNEENKLDTHLIKIYTNQYEHEMIQRLISYPSSNAGFNDGRFPELPEDYFSFLDEVKMPESIDDLGAGAYFFVNSVLRKKHELAETKLDFYEFAEQELPDRMAFVYKAYALDRDFNKDLYDAFGESCPYPEIASLVKKRYGHLEGMLEGSQGPEFSLKDTDGNLYKLADFKGDNVYIDFWATWCKPCIKEIPYLEVLQDEYKGKELQFISISIDSEKDTLKWKTFVKDNDLKGIQLWADEEHHEMFSKNLNIKSIPRFVLLDKEGKIIDAQAPRPSDPRLKSILDGLTD